VVLKLDQDLVLVCQNIARVLAVLHSSSHGHHHDWIIHMYIYQVEGVRERAAGHEERGGGWTCVGGGSGVYISLLRR
jgi:hypothetical protein